MKNNKMRNVWWGIFFIVAAVAIILSQLGFLGNIGFFTILLTVLLVPFMIWNLVHLEFFGTFIPAGILLILYRDTLHLPRFSAWAIILSAIFLSIGMSMLVKKRKKTQWVQDIPPGEIPTSATYATDSDTVFHKETFGSTTKHINSDNLQRAALECTFGGLKVHFDHARLNPAGAEVFLDCNFSGVTLYIPKSWQVFDHIDTPFSSVKSVNEQREFPPDAPQLRLCGSVTFSNLTIFYV